MMTTDEDVKMILMLYYSQAVCVPFVSVLWYARAKLVEEGFACLALAYS